MRFLLFTLYAPMGSLGEVAVGERRMGWARPGRSAVFGLVAAARGIDRADEDAHRSLERELHYAVRTDSAGRPIVDYHTAQTPRARRGRTFETRRRELESGDLHTVLSGREWRTDACFTAALWPRRASLADLGEIRDSLRRPRFTLYLGRKAAPFGLPLDPAVIEAETLVEAFGKRCPNAMETEVLARIGADDGGEIAFDAGAPGAPGADARLLRERRRDAVVSRGRWQFADRLEDVALRRGADE